jgi:hypothetical protein
VNIRHLLLSCSLVFASAYAQAQTSDATVRGRDAEWMSYRDAYRTMLSFEKYGKPKNLIQNHLQVVSKDKTISIESVRLALLAKTSQFVLALDATGRTALPLHKSAYDENAELVLNLKQAQAKFRSRISIIVRADGMYPLEELSNACDQALAFQTFIDPYSFKGKKCLGVSFAFPKKDQAAAVELKGTNKAAQTLKINEDNVLWEDSALSFRTVQVLFSGGLEKMLVTTHTTPVIITPVYD